MPSKRKKEKKKPSGRLDTAALCFKRLVTSESWKIDINVHTVFLTMFAQAVIDSSCEV
jgi:hypothetical protein